MALATRTPVEPSSGQQYLSNALAALIATLPLPAKNSVTEVSALEPLLFQPRHQAGRVCDASCLIGSLTNLKRTPAQVIQLF